LASANGGPVEEGNVGGGTGSICHEFKGGIGTASRVIPADRGGHTVGVLVQANYGKREWLRVDGVPVGAEIGTAEISSPHDQDTAHGRAGLAPGSGSIIAVIATDAPLLPHQCERMAQRAGLGIARAGGTGGHTSGDLFIAFATGNRLPTEEDEDRPRTLAYDVRAVGDGVIDALFDGVIEATEEAIVNALVGAKTMVGRDGVTAHALPHDRLLEIMARYGRGPRAV
jgi:D-aminopeptidase